MRLYLILSMLCSWHSIFGMDTVRVNTPTQLIDSLRSDCLFLLEPGIYSFEQLPAVQALDPSRAYTDVAFNKSVHYASGDGIILYLLKNVIIEGLGTSPDQTSLQGANLEDEVLTLLGCENVRFKNLQLTHPAHLEGNIKGGLIKVSQSTGVKIEKCELLGRASTGMTVWRSKNVELADSKIMNCSYGAIDLKDSWTLRIHHCTVEANKGCQQLWSMSGCTDVKINDNLIVDNVQRESRSCENGQMFRFSRCEMVVLSNNVLKGNEFDLLGDAEVLRLLGANNDYKKNKFGRLSPN